MRNVHICDGFFYCPTQRSYARPEELGLRYDSVWFPTGDGLRLNGWFFPAQTATTRNELPGRGSYPEQNSDQARGTILHLHGNAGNMSAHFPHAAWLAVAGWNVFCFDYRGYGQSQGAITRSGTVLDTHAALDYLLTRPDVDSGRIVAFGQSLGGALGIVLAAERPEILALATDGAFDSYQRIAAWHIRNSFWLRPIAWWVPRLLMSMAYDPIDCIHRIAPRSVLIIHGTADAIVPCSMAQRLYDAAGEPKQLWLVDDADHYDPLSSENKDNRSKLLAFFSHAVARHIPD